MESLQKLGGRVLSTIIPPDSHLLPDPIMSSSLHLPPSTTASSSRHSKDTSNSQSHARKPSATDHRPVDRATITPSTANPSFRPTPTNSATDHSTSTIHIARSEPDINIDLITHVPDQHALHEWRGKADLTRDYEAICADLTTKSVEPCPSHTPIVSPTGMQKFGADRPLLAQIAGRCDYWRSGVGTVEEYEMWKRAVKDDLFMLINEVAEAGTGKRKIRPFWERCTERLEEVDERGKRVELGDVQVVINEVLEEMDMEIRCEEGRFKVLKEIGKIKPAHEGVEASED